MKQLVARALVEESGQDLSEYAMLAAFISLVATTFILNIGTRVNEWYSGYADTINTIPTGS
jgi:Flp pilus assembly pilin Flp